MYHVLRNLKHWIHMCFLCGHTSTSLDTARFLYASFIPYAKVPGFQDSSKALRHTDFFLFYIWKRLIQRNNESLRQWLVYSQGQYTDWACVWKTKLNNPKWVPLRPRLPSQSQTASPGSRRLRPEDKQDKEVEIPSQKTHLGETWNSLLPLCGLVTSSPTGWDHSEEKKFYLLSLSSHPLRHTYSKGRGGQITTIHFCTAHWKKKKNTKEQIFTFFSDERKHSKKSISWHEIISQYDMILQYEMISQYEIQISKKRKKFKKEMQISMKLLSELSVKRLFTGSLWLLSHATAKAISCYRNCTSHKLWCIYSLSFVSVHKLPSRQKTCRESDGEKRRKCDTGRCKIREDAKCVSTLPAFDPQQGRAGQRSDFTTL